MSLFILESATNNYSETTDKHIFFPRPISGDPREEVDFVLWRDNVLNSLAEENERTREKKPFPVITESYRRHIKEQSIFEHIDPDEAEECFYSLVANGLISEDQFAKILPFVQRQESDIMLILSVYRKTNNVEKLQSNLTEYLEVGEMLTPQSAHLDHSSNIRRQCFLEELCDIVKDNELLDSVLTDRTLIEQLEESFYSDLQSKPTKPNTAKCNLLLKIINYNSRP